MVGGAGGRADGSLSLEVRLPRGWTLVKQKHTTLTDVSGQTPTTRADRFGPRAFRERKKKICGGRRKKTSQCLCQICFSWTRSDFWTRFMATDGKAKKAKADGCQNVVIPRLSSSPPLEFHHVRDIKLEDSALFYFYFF